MFGIFQHEVLFRKVPLVRGFDDVFLAPHSRHTGIDEAAVAANDKLQVLARSETAGTYIVIADEGKQIFVTGHSEYDRLTLDKEYHRDLAKGLPIEVPYNYYKDDNPENKPLLTWRSNSNCLYSNWLNYYVYQSTPYELK
jgi:homoserine O-succinyltransferase